jgi:hypothetical protein
MKWFGKRSWLNFAVVALVFFLTIINVFFSFHNQSFVENTYAYHEQTSADFAVVSDLLEDEDETFVDDELAPHGTQSFFVSSVLSIDPHLHHWVNSPLVRTGIQTPSHHIFLQLRKILI